MTTSAVMPRYFGFKMVHALKIGAVDGVTITPEDPKFAPIVCEPQMFSRFHPKPGDYLVVYPDGYSSFSPAAAFESGYAALPRGQAAEQYEEAVRMAENPDISYSGPQARRIVKNLLAMLGKDPCYLKAAVRGTPTFTLVANDKHASETIRYWARRAESTGSPTEKVQGAKEIAMWMDEWPTQKIPD